MILTHSEEGITFGEENYPEYAHKIKYLIHPLKEIIQVKEEKTKKYDLLIWGSIYPYKGVVDFLSFLKSTVIHQQAFW